jgi:CarboxypepD_reg-like domain
MRYSFLLSLFFLGVCVVGSAQTLRGHIKDATTGEAVPYVSVGLLRTAYGTVANTAGNFELSQLPSDTGLDSIAFYCIGYAKKVITRSMFAGEKPIDIALQPVSILLKEAVIVPDQSRSVWIGEDDISTSMGVNFALNQRTNQNLGSEVGRRFKIKKPSRLEQFRFFVRQNNFEVVRFRINVYAIGKNGQPAENLLQIPIIVTLSDKKSGWIDVDLAAYDIRTSESVVVSAEWIDFSGSGTVLSLPIGLLRFGGGHFYKYGSQNTWKVFRNMSAAMQLRIVY